MYILEVREETGHLVVRRRLRGVESQNSERTFKPIKPFIVSVHLGSFR